MADIDENDDSPDDHENADDQLDQALRFTAADPLLRKEIGELLVGSVLEGFDDLPLSLQKLVVEILRKKGNDSLAS